MLTLFSIPKAFGGHVGDIQHNAIASWARLPGCQVILFGDDDGVEEAAAAHGVEFGGALERSAENTPRLDQAFERAQSAARHSVVCYCNADIIHYAELLDAIAACRVPRFLAVGRRTNLDVAGNGGSSDQWADSVRRRAISEGELHPPTGIDYFAFPRGQIAEMPAFPVGRALWDNWMIYEHRRRGIPVVDLTASVLVVHQNHDYGHIAGGKRAAWFGSEASRTRQMLGPDFFPFTISDATWRLEDGRLRRNLGARQLLRRAAVWPALVPGLRRGVRVARTARRELARVLRALR
jgi:hypothetical protein